MVIIDFHVHIDESEKANANGIPVKKGRAEILKQMDEAGIDISVLLVTARRGNMAETKAQNKWLSNICKENRRFVGFGSVHPADGKAALQEMNRCVNKLGLRGFKFHPDSQEFDCGDRALVKILEQAAKLDVPVLMDSYSALDDTQPSKLFKAIWETPETTICLAHAGMFRFMDFAIYGLIKQQTTINLNVYFDLSCSLTLFYGSPLQDQFCWVTKQIGPDNLLFGSDFPSIARMGSEHSSRTMKFALETVRNYGYPKKWIPKIIGENAAKLLRI